MAAKGFIASKIGTVGIVVGLIIGAALISKKFDLGNTTIGALSGFGQSVGAGILAPIQGLLDGITLGGEGLGLSAVSLSEGFQKSVSNTLGGGENVFSEFGNDDIIAPSVSNVLFQAQPTQGNSLDSILQGLKSSFSGISSQSRQLSEFTNSQSNELNISNLSNLVNPVASSPTVGIFTLFGSTVPLSQSAINFYREAGIPLKQVG